MADWTNFSDLIGELISNVILTFLLAIFDFAIEMIGAVLSVGGVFTNPGMWIFTLIITYTLYRSYEAWL